MPVRPFHPRPTGFTLLELVFVMAIIAIIAAVMVPSLSAFSTGRRTANAATAIIGMANYARSQAISQGTVFRLNFDGTSRQVWLTMQVDGAFEPAKDFPDRYQLPEGVSMFAQVTPGSVATPVISPNVQTSFDVPNPIFGQAVGTPNTLQMMTHTDGGTYVEVQPSGRTDPCKIHLSDTVGHQIDLGAATATDVLHALKPGEM